MLFGIPDIRLFWTEDPRFHKQFEGAVAGRHETFPTFKEYSKYPECYKDVSFWLPEDGFHENLVHELVREGPRLRPRTTPPGTPQHRTQAL